MPGYVYLIGSPTFHWYKIGRSRLPHLRVKNIGIILPFKIELIATWFTVAERVLERELHEKYAANHINGEWFRFTAKEVKAMLAEIPYAEVHSKVKFTNIEKDAAPTGQVIKIDYKPDLTPEEREARKQKGMAESAARKAACVPCLTCGRRCGHAEVKNPLPAMNS
jgi:hypothetical protein